MQRKTVRDPIHEYISFSEEERKLIDSPWFQRLRHCSQNGPTRLVYPSLLGTRFEHSLGVMDLASRMLDSVLHTGKYSSGSKVVGDFIRVCKRDLKLFLGRRRTDEQVIADVRRILRGAALCHDLGHFPLSHTLERAFRQEFWSAAIPKYLPTRACHEMVSAEIVRHILDTQDTCLEDWIARAAILTLLAPSALTVNYNRHELPFSKTMFSTLNGILAGDYDADRLDYLQRDGYLSGSGFGNFDVERFIDAMALVKHNETYVVMPSSRALSTIEAALIERYKLYKWVYFHHKTLFFDEVCCEAGRKLLRPQNTSAKLLRRYDPRVADPRDYLKKVLKSLSSPSKRIPPLVLFVGKTLELSRPYYVLRPEFFIQNPQMHFFDDVWFCQQCRLKSNFGGRGKFYVEALVDRQPCGVTLWKDWSQFTLFSSCIAQAAQSSQFADKVDAESYKLHVPSFLNNLWRLMREGEFPESVTQQIVVEGASQLKANSFSRIRPLVRIADWGLFGNLGEKQIIGRTGKPDYLVNHSTVLKELSNLKGEIPFYVFLVGEAADVDLLKKKQANLRRVLTIMAKTFIKAIVNCLGMPQIKEAWNEAIRPGT